MRERVVHKVVSNGGTNIISLVKIMFILNQSLKPLDRRGYGSSTETIF
jgi:hypothetical protein